jgi:hypothetical protein
VNRFLPWVAVGGLTFAVCTVQLFAQPDQKPPPKAAKLPLTRVVLTTAGVGYFHREGTIDGTARVELKVNEEDVNDLILTLLASDPNGTTRAVTYDNRAPAEITLKAFSIDLTENPSVGHLLNQVRGEKVEIAHGDKDSTIGSILSVEKPGETVTRTDETVTTKKPPAGAVEQVNLFTDDGLVSVPLSKIKKVKFVKPELQAEFRAALEALAAARGEAKKAVAVTFNGQGQRKVSLGYMADAPLWKPTYRLSLAGNGAMLESLAAIENTTDEDWKDVRVKLVSGRPITFKMDLYDPLFVPRPVVEPELYASLRPPMYQGPGSMFGGQFGIQGGGALGQVGAGGGAIGQQALQQNLGVFGGGGFGGNANFGMIQGQQTGYGGISRPSVRSMLGQRPTYEGMVKDQKERMPQRDPDEERPNKPKVYDPTDTLAGVNLGEAFEYAVADPVTLPRFKSALVPVLNEKIEAERLSIFNPAVLPGYPLKGLRVKNTSKLFLAQGPVTIYEGDGAAGQARLPDVKPGDTRLLSYAIDLDLPIRAEIPFTAESPGMFQTSPVSMKISGGKLSKVMRVKATSRYTAVNKGTEAKTVWVTQPIKSGWKLIAPAKAAETTPDLQRFEMKVPAGEKVTLEVIEEQDQTTDVELAKLTADQLDLAVREPTTPPAVKAALGRVKANLTARGDADKGIADENAALKEIVEEQSRLRANLATVPKESDAYKRYVKKFDDQETDIEKRRAKVKELEQTKQKLAKELTDLLKELKAE